MKKFFTIILLLTLSGCFFKSSNHGKSNHYRKKNPVETHWENQSTLRRGHGIYKPQHQYPHMNREFKKKYGH